MRNDNRPIPPTITEEQNNNIVQDKYKDNLADKCLVILRKHRVFEGNKFVKNFIRDGLSDEASMEEFYDFLQRVDKALTMTAISEPKAAPLRNRDKSHSV